MTVPGRFIKGLLFTAMPWHSVTNWGKLFFELAKAFHDFGVYFRPAGIVRNAAFPIKVGVRELEIPKRPRIGRQIDGKKRSVLEDTRS